MNGETNTQVVKNSKVEISAVVREVVDFFGLEAKSIDISEDPKNPDLFVWLASFVDVEKTITGPVSGNLKRSAMKQQIAMSMLVGLHPLGEAITMFVYAQQIMGKVPSSLAEATKAMCYLLVSDLAKVYKNNRLQEEFLSAITLPDILRVVFANKEDKKKRRH